MSNPLVKAEQIKISTEKKIKELWAKLGDEENIEEAQEFIDFFEEIHRESIAKHPEYFTVQLKDLNTLIRCQKGAYFNNYNRMIPDRRFCKNNRWNPDGVAFLYLGLNKSTISNTEKTCFEECRLKNGDYATVCQFNAIKTTDKVINLCYETLPYETLDSGLTRDVEPTAKQIIKPHLKKIRHLQSIGAYDAAKSYYLSALHQVKQTLNSEEFKKSQEPEIEIFLATSLLKSLEDSVIKPLDEIKDPERKAYIPFRYFAKYLMSKGYKGIIYKSTRMNLIGSTGTNLVLFDKSYASYIEGTLKVYLISNEQPILIPSSQHLN